MKRKWTYELRKHLYSLLVYYHGPYELWEKTASPGCSRNLQGLSYEATLTLIADALAAISGDEFESTAVQQQVKWAVSRQTHVKHTGHRYTQIQNLVAAIDCGFMRNKHLEFFEKEMDLLAL